MEAAQLGSGNRICTVVFVDIVQYSEGPVSKQAEMKARFGALLGTALEHSPAADRLVLDTGDGAALCFLGDPEDALFAANSLRSAVLEASGSPALQLRLGINLGPVRIVKDVNGQRNIIGDGINVAQRVMNFAAPNQILVSRSYYEVVSRLSPDYGQLFNYIGLHKDKHVREHEVYEVQLSGGQPGRREEDAPPTADAPTGTRFSAEFLGQLTGALAREIGPVAKLIVRKAAARAADGRRLCEALASNVPEAGRAAFLAGLTKIPGVTSAPPGAGSTREPVPAETRSASEQAGIGADLLARAEQMLSRQIGPLARLLVREAAKSAKSPRDLFQRLAGHIDDAKARERFLAEADRSGS
jgi:class 3 adenylate cyclase